MTSVLAGSGQFPSPSSAIPRSQHGFSDGVWRLLDRIDCRRADTAEDREAISRLRYEAYLREGAISPNPSGTFSDPYDYSENAYLFGLYIDGVLASSVRLHVGSREHPDFPSLHVFPDVLQKYIDAGNVIVDTTRFVADETLSRRYRGLPYVTLRLSWLSLAYFKADYSLAAVRTEHQAFYRRTFRHDMLCEPRPYPHLEKPICLMAMHYPTVTDDVHRRYPFFRSTLFERRMMFERQAAPGIQPNHETAEGNEASSGRGNISPFRERDRSCLAG
jgi:hypothetical protein